MAFPALAQGFESTPAIVWLELHRENIAQLAIEVGAFRLGPLDHADCDVPQRLKPPGDNPQRHRLPGTGLTRDQREAPLPHQLFDAAGKTFDLGGHQQPIAGEFWRKRVPFQPPQRKQFLGIHDASPVWEGGVLGRYAGGSPVAEYSARICFRSGGSVLSLRWLGSAGASLFSGATPPRRPSALALLSRG